MLVLVADSLYAWQTFNELKDVFFFLQKVSHGAFWLTLLYISEECIFLHNFFSPVKAESSEKNIVEISSGNTPEISI